LIRLRSYLGVEIVCDFGCKTLRDWRKSKVSEQALEFASSCLESGVLTQPGTLACSDARLIGINLPGVYIKDRAEMFFAIQVQ
jgi:hypothetical protein